ncbi:MAG: HEAT repeat domain-containing protein, partial [Candidatus Micrarchaeota archaeon]
ATANINKLVSLTFDEDPEVRKRAAKSLAEINDPGAVFALMELGFDKDPAVREVAQEYLEKKKKTEPELMSFASIFSSNDKKDGKEEKEEPGVDARERMLRPITQIFEKRLGKEKAEMAKSKLMPTIEKVYSKAHQHHNKKKSDDNGRKVMQEFLTNYLEVMSDLDRVGGEGVIAVPEAEKEIAASAQPAATVVVQEGQGLEAVREAVDNPEPHEPLTGELEEVGKSGAETDMLAAEAASLELQHIEEMKEQAEIEQLPDTFFKKAYEIMMLSEGDEKLMNQERDRMIDEARNEIGLAFKMAKKRFKEMTITNITKITNGMRNVNTGLLTVKGAENIEYQKSKKTKATASRILVNDEEGNEGVVYLFDGRGTGIQAGMRIKVVNGMAKTFEFSGETALTLGKGKKSNVYIVL